MALSIQVGDIVAKSSQPFAVQLSLVVNQQGRANFDYESAKFGKSQPRHELANKQMLSIER